MKQVLHVFLCALISFGLAREDILLKDDGQTTLEEKSRQYDQVAKEAKASGPAIQWFKSQYIDPKCCNFSTTDRCSRMGSYGFNGYCMPRNETCIGKQYLGTKYCVISKYTSCKCCVPTDCKRQTLDPCSILKGSCIGVNDQCDGTSVVSEQFCKRDGGIDTCKCCIPSDCHCENERKCLRPDAESEGYYPTGHCRKECHDDEVKWDTCDINPQGSCHCCLRKKGCDPSNCRVYSHDLSASTFVLVDGRCSRNPIPDSRSVGQQQCRDGCECYITDDGKSKENCISKKNMCSGPGDYCVNKFDGDCPKGFGKVLNACYNKTSECDCCKSLDCTSIGDKCTGKGEYCLGSESEACKKGYIATEDCKKAVVEDGRYKERKCTCCKPQKENVCGPYCTSIPKPLHCVCMVPGLPCLEGYCYDDRFKAELCGQKSCLCCGQKKLPAGLVVS